MTGFARRAERDRDILMSAAWHNASLMRAKKFPDLDKFLSKRPAPKRSRKPKTWEQQLSSWGRFTERGG